MFIISLSLAHEFHCQLYVKTGTQTREKFADVQKVAAAGDHNICCALPGLHSFTGCDTVSAFVGKGKISAFKLMQKNRKYQGAFTQSGKEWSVPRDLSSVLQEFTCKLYATRCPSVGVNELKYQLFRAKKGEVESGRFPPCEDCLFMHSLRANYQARVWRRALEECRSIPNPSRNLWRCHTYNLLEDRIACPRCYHKVPFLQVHPRL